MVEKELPEELAEKQLSSIFVELNSVVECQANSTRDEVIMGYRNKEKDMQQQNILQERIHPMYEMDKKIQEIRRLMLK